MSNQDTTRYYCKTVAISEEALEWLKETKGTKSAAGRLNEVIEFYKLNNMYANTSKSI